MKSINKSFSRRLGLILALFLLIGFSQLNQSVAQSSQGTDFWICFPGNFDLQGARQLYITSQFNAVVNIDIVNPAFSTIVNVTAGTLTTVNLPVNVDINTSGVVENKGIHITSDNPVTVYGMSQRDASSDAFLALPVDALGNDYFVMAYTNTIISVQMNVVATQDNTTVTITPTVSGSGFTAGVPGNVVLNQGQSLQLRSTAIGTDYTGSRVQSDKPVSVFGGNSCVNIPSGIVACDIIVEQITPNSSWGQSFVTIPLATRLAGDIFRVLAQQNSTQVSINGVVVANLNAGQFYETSLPSNSYNRITSNKPILLAQFSKGTYADYITSDPFMTLIPPDEQFLNNYVISAGTSNIPINYLNITSPTTNTGSVLVDGAPVASWVPIPGTLFSGAQVSVTNGVHTVSSTLPIGLMVYGFGNADSYGYLGGQAFAAVATIATLDLTPPVGSASVGSNQCWTAEVLDSNGDPVSGARVDFTITGVNPGSGFAFTNALGIATYCYIGANGGNDVIVANVGALTDTATFDWGDVPLVPLSNWALIIGLILIFAVAIFRFKRF
jgi:hypothetical protein